MLDPLQAIQDRNAPTATFRSAIHSATSAADGRPSGEPTARCRPAATPPAQRYAGDGVHRKHVPAADPGKHGHGDQEPTS